MKRPDAPVPPVIELCSFINEGNPYFYCRFSNGTEQRWRVPASQENSGKLACTYMTSYAKIEGYSDKFDAYINDKLEQCERRIKKLQESK